MSKAVMIQGTGSDVGKSLLVAGLCRAAANRGIKVAPFKSQNMSNNAAVTADGGEIGRAQALQALAARLSPHTDMNPVLLKPESEQGAQVIVQGKRAGTQLARDFGKSKQSLIKPVLESFTRLKAQYDLVIVEGAGSPAEINLRAGDIANMGFAEAANVPVILTGDINKGGVIAQIVGTQAVLPPEDAAHIKAFIVNKFRGDAALFDEGLVAIEQMTSWPSIGVVPWFFDACRLPAEDAPELTGGTGGTFKIAVPLLSRIANFDDFDPLASEPDVSLVMVPPGLPLPADAQLVILPGSKSTIADLAFMRAQGWDIDLAAHIRRGGHVLGICGGYQMLGQTIADSDNIEGSGSTAEGLGYLEVHTVMKPEKRVRLTKARDPVSGAAISGYEIHLGETTGVDCARDWLRIGQHKHGASSPNGRIRGCYLHGLFTSDAYRSAFLRSYDVRSTISYDSDVDATLNALATHLEQHLDINHILKIAG
ncbi:cobyric acid synthase [Lentibacter algarum]|uniref:cobyric acid synthase n=1 Tax=Lentibacter algarum TaxID=576131 RepID=UPI001C07C13C|nr:cobyric acid synthase [Lentibacter algarum]MBU2981975.1 cobyric acid synthase [Lentibacter algarum]